MWIQALTVGIVLFATRWAWRRWKYDLHKIPSPPGLPFVGHTYQLLYGKAGEKGTDFLKSSFASLGYPKLLKVEAMGSNVLFATDLAFIKSVMLSKNDCFPKNADRQRMFEPMLGIDPETKCSLPAPFPTPYVKAIRRAYVTSFQANNLKRAVPKLLGTIERAMLEIEKKRVAGPVDIQALFVKMTLDAIGVVTLDSNLGGLDGSRRLYDLILKVGHLARERTSNPFKRRYVALFPNSNLAQSWRNTFGALKAEWEKLAEEMLAKADPPNGEEFLWHAIKTMVDPETGKPIERNSFRAEISSLVIAGMDTTGHQLGWIVALLASHPHVVKKLLEELNEHGLLGIKARALAFEDLSELTYLAAVVREGMRIAHVIPDILARKVPKDMSILGYRVPEGASISCPGDHIYSLAAEWGDPETFRPERWLVGEDMSEKYNMPFSVGSRDCVGQRLAVTEMRLTIAELVKRYSFTLTRAYEDLARHTRVGIVIEASRGIWLNFTPRE